MAKENEEFEELETTLPEDEDDDRGDNLGDEDEDIDEGDEDTEEEDESEEEVEDDDEEDVPAPKNNIKIPKYRLDQEIEKVKALKERESWLEQQLEKLINSKPELKQEVQNVKEEITFDFDAAEEQYITFVLEGETKEAIKLRKQIDAVKNAAFNKVLEVVKAEAAEQAIQQGNTAKDDAKFQEYISNYESKYPFLNRGKKAYNEDAVDTINTLMAGFMAKGVIRSEALKKAVEKVLPMYTTSTTVATDKRTVEQRKRNVSANKKQPPNIKGKSFKDTSIEDFDVEGLNEKEFAKLAKDKRALAKLRGDVV
jgi:hypothetical protein